MKVNLNYLPLPTNDEAKFEWMYVTLYFLGYDDILGVKPEIYPRGSNPK